jgi:hypothetical protein
MSYKKIQDLSCSVIEEKFKISFSGYHGGTDGISWLEETILTLV